MGNVGKALFRMSKHIKLMKVFLRPAIELCTFMHSPHSTSFRCRTVFWKMKVCAPVTTRIDSSKCSDRVAQAHNHRLKSTMDWRALSSTRWLIATLSAAGTLESHSPSTIKDWLRATVSSSSFPTTFASTATEIYWRYRTECQSTCSALWSSILTIA